MKSDNKARYIFISFVLCCLYATASGQIFLSKDRLLFDSDEKNAVIIQIDCPNVWNFSCHADWLRIDKLPDRLAIASVSANDTIVDRTATITITSGKETKQLTVTQSAAEMRFQTDVQQLTFPNKGDTKVLTVNANLPWTIDSWPEWCKIERNGERISVSVEMNSEKSVLSGTLILTGGNKRIDIAVKQRGNGIFDKLKDTMDNVIKK